MAQFRRPPEDGDKVENFVHDQLQGAGLLGTTWGKIIIAAAQSGNFTDGERLRAGSWVTCACGMLKADIEVNSYGKPLDFQLETDGANFSHAVSGNLPANASIYLRRIEARAAELTYQPQPQGDTQEASTD